MTIEEKDMERLRDHLTKKFRSGHKWVAYTHPYDFELVTCYRDIKSVNRLCEHIHGDISYFKFKPLVNILKDLSGASEVAASKIDIAKVEDQVSCYPISAYIYDNPLSHQLASGSYQPLNWKIQVDPSIVVDKYHVVIGKGTVDKNTLKPIINQTSSSYREVEKAFQQTVDRYCSLDGIFNPTILLVGQMKGQELKLAHDGRPKENSGIVFKMAYRHMDYSILQLNDPAKLVDIYQPMMGKFNLLTSHLDFFDGQLQKVLPGAKIEFMNFDRLSNDNERLIVRNGISFQDGLIKNVQEGEGRQRNKLRPGQSL